MVKGHSIQACIKGHGQKGSSLQKTDIYGEKKAEGAMRPIIMSISSTFLFKLQTILLFLLMFIMYNDRDRKLTGRDNHRLLYSKGGIKTDTEFPNIAVNT